MSENETIFQTVAALYTDIPDIIELLEELNLDMEDIHYSQFHILRDKGELVAAGRIRVHEDNTLELCSLGVAQDYRKRGIGTTLVSQLIHSAKSDEIWAVSEIPEFFIRSGFEEIHEYPEILNEKKQRCLEQYACSSPIVLYCNKSKIA